MFGLTWWWMLLLLPLPVLASKFLPRYNRVESALQVPILNRSSITIPALTTGTARLAKFSLWFFWVCLLVAASRPFWLEEPTHRTMSGRDLMLAIDISGSMEEADMFIGSKVSSRIDVLKAVVNEFIDRRKGDRLGLVLFGSRAYAYVPLTFDRQTLGELLDGVSTGLAGRFTAIGDAIGVSLKTLGKQQSRNKVLILVTDGDNTGGVSNPLDAARIAAHEGMTIYTIGVGNDETTMNRLAQQRNIPQGTFLNVRVLQQIAAVSGGQYFHARDTASLQKIYQTLDELEPVELNSQLHRPKLDLFHWPLMIGMAAVLLFFCHSIFVTARFQRK